MSELTSDQEAEIGMLKGLHDALALSEFLIDQRPDLAKECLHTTLQTLHGHILELTELYRVNNIAVKKIEKDYAQRQREKTAISLSQVRKWK